MPYIKREDRPGASVAPMTRGELNFKLCTLLERFIINRPLGMCYDNVNDVVGVLELAKLDLSLSGMFERTVEPPSVASTLEELRRIVVSIGQDVIRNLEDVSQDPTDRVIAVVGAFECAKLEFYRRVAAPYEDQKAHQNGDIFNLI